MRRSAMVVTIAFLSLSCTRDRQAAETWSKTVPAKDKERFQQVLDYRKKGEFERAVAVAIEPAHGNEPDDFLLQATAITYFQRAQTDSSNKEKWVALAVQYSERAVKANPSSLVNVFNVGDSYMAAGMNLGTPQACPYYEKSLHVFEQLRADPALQGEWGTMDGERVLLAPYRKKLDQHLETLPSLGLKCPSFSKAQ